MMFDSEENNPERSSKTFLFFDVDGTLIEQDTGRQLFSEAGICEPQRFKEVMSETHEDGKDEPPQGRGNELALKLDKKPRTELEKLRDVAEQLEVDRREGFQRFLEEVHEDYRILAHSAGWKVPIQAVTNGYFEEKLAATVEDGLTLNGRYQKPVRMQNYILGQGIEDPVEDDFEAVYVGDSKTDSEALRYADATGGLGLVVGEQMQDIEDVEPATVYIADPTGDQDLAGAFLYHYLNGRDKEDTARFIEEQELDPSKGEFNIRETVEDQRYEELKKTLEEVRAVEWQRSYV